MLRRKVKVAMRRLGLPVVAAVCTLLLPLLLTGCWVSSLQPLESDCRKTLYDTALIGAWTVDSCTKQEESSEAKQCKLLIRGGESCFLSRHRYELYLTDEAGRTTRYVANLVQLGDGQTLTLTRLDSEWLQTNLNQKKIWIAHVKVDDIFVLTAPTPRLRRFILLHATDPAAFPESRKLVWRRVASEGGTF